MIISGILSSLVGVGAKLGMKWFESRDKKLQQQRSIAMMKLELLDKQGQRAHELAMASYAADREDNRVKFQADVDMNLSADEITKTGIEAEARTITLSQPRWDTFLKIYRSTVRPNLSYMFSFMLFTLIGDYIGSTDPVLTSEQFTTLLMAMTDLAITVVSFWFTGRVRA